MSIIKNLLDKKSKFDFIKSHRIVFSIAFVLFAITVSSLYLSGLNYDIDSMGGILIEIKSDKKIDVDEIHNILEKAGIADLSIQSLGEHGNEALIRVLEKGKDEKSQIQTIIKIKEALGNDYKYQKIEIVGPMVGPHVRNQINKTDGSLIASALDALAIAISVWFTSIMATRTLLTAWVYYCRPEKITI